MPVPKLGWSSLVLAGVLFLACSDDGSTRGNEGETSRTVAQELVPQVAQFTGASLGAKQIVLTFDDGPGPMAVTGELATWLKNRPKPIRATFFVNGACIAATTLPNDSCPAPIPNAAAVIERIAAEGHTVANHSTSHRDITKVPAAERERELADTDVLIAPHIAWNRFLYRAAYGAWSADVFNTLSTTPMNKYVGPIYWDIGGGPTSATRAADWDCWAKNYTTKRCGDLYLTETRTLGKGISLMHDPHGNTANHDINAGRGNTADMVKYIVPILEAEGFEFKALHEVPTVAAALPACDASCKDCSGPNANQCTSCEPGKFASSGVCTACKVCPPGTHEASACGGDKDTVCTCDACDDGNACTTDTCSERGCDHTPISGCSSPPDGGPGVDKGKIDPAPEDPSDDGCTQSPRHGTGSAWLLGLGLTLAIARVRRRRARVYSTPS